LSDGELREPDHKFEWNRAKFRDWALGIARRNGYRVAFGGIGEEDPELGPPTQTACFSLPDVAQDIGSVHRHANDHNTLKTAYDERDRVEHKV